MSDKRRSELGSNSHIDLSEEEKKSQSSMNDLNELDELDVNEINLNHNEFFRHQDSKVETQPSPLAPRKDLSFASFKDSSFLGIKTTAISTSSESQQEAYWMLEHPKLVSTPAIIVNRQHGNVLKSIEDGSESDRVPGTLVPVQQ